MYLKRFYLIFKAKLPIILLANLLLNILSIVFAKEKLAIYLQFIGILIINEYFLMEIFDVEERRFRRFVRQNGRNIANYFAQFFIFTFLLFFINYIILFFITENIVTLFAINCIILLHLCTHFAKQVWQKGLLTILIFIIIYLNL